MSRYLRRRSSRRRVSIHPLPPFGGGFFVIRKSRHYGGVFGLQKEPKPRVRFRFLLAERGGFEPPDTLPHRTLSKRVPSTTQPSLHDKCSRLFCGFYPQLEYNTTSSGKNQAYKRGNRAVFARNFLDHTCKAAYGMIYFIKRRAKRRGEKNERSFFIYNGSP